MNKQAIETIAVKSLEIGKKLIDYWYKKKLEHDRVTRCRKVMP